MQNKNNEKRNKETENNDEIHNLNIQMEKDLINYDRIQQAKDDINESINIKKEKVDKAMKNNEITFANVILNSLNKHEYNQYSILYQKNEEIKNNLEEKINRYEQLKKNHEKGSHYPQKRA